jgi:putative ABC transport system substrate-binding protein
MIRRRDFFTLLGGAAAAWPVVVRAQQATLPVVGLLSGRSSAASEYLAAAFRKGLGEVGFIDGQNIRIEYRYAEEQYDRLPASASELVRLRVAAIATSDTASVLAAKAATSAIPIVFTVAGDPVALGLVASLSRPGGNLTGHTNLAEEVTPKRLELLRELVPQASRIGYLMNPTNPNGEFDLKEIQTAAHALRLQIHIVRATTERDFESAFAALDQLRVDALVIETNSIFTSRSGQLASLAVRHALPAAYVYPEFAAGGGLMSYGASITDSHRFVGAYVGRILKGEKPANLPVQQATRTELVINLKTAKALGVTVPITLLGRADEVIE